MLFKKWLPIHETSELLSKMYSCFSGEQIQAQKGLEVQMNHQGTWFLSIADITIHFLCNLLFFCWFDFPFNYIRALATLIKFKVSWPSIVDEETIKFSYTLFLLPQLERYAGIFSFRQLLNLYLCPSCILSLGYWNALFICFRVLWVESDLISGRCFKRVPGCWILAPGAWEEVKQIFHNKELLKGALYTSQ